MIITDTHTHLYSEQFDDDRVEVIERALAAGVTRFFIPAIDSSYTNAMYALEASYPNHMFLMTGVHPCHVKADYLVELAHIKEQLNSREFVAIGEIGIDLYWDRSTLKLQQEMFKLQIQLAKQYRLPVVIHCRDAFDEVFQILEGEKGSELFGIFHCFMGNLEQAQKAISFNMKLGIGGVVTFKNGKIDQFLKEISLDHIVLETDAPYLAPVPYRGKRNESSYILNVLEKLSDIYSMSSNEIASITTKNSKSIFKK
jgi:TatD DNase family protein